MPFSLENIESDLRRLCEEFDIRTMYLFGSALTESFGPQSDIDILISFKELPFDKYTDNFFRLHESLEALFGRKVDLLTERSLSNPVLIKSIQKTRRLLYAA